MKINTKFLSKTMINLKKILYYVFLKKSVFEFIIKKYWAPKTSYFEDLKNFIKKTENNENIYCKPCI
ncbi:MAG: hypothetical protein A2X12_07200 [Bacteroidetes bacterium GWE2_29_8]|nr:MAG: hypothetical protein A2X12_07200 [Bacteroidetes bacterium GWE2_29_8]